MTQLETLLARLDSLKAQWDTARPMLAPLLQTLPKIGNTPEQP